jgi:hypothetical protein
MFCDLIGQPEQLLGAFDQDGAGTLVTAVFAGEASQAGPLLGRHHQGLLFSSNATGDDPTSVELALGAVAIGFTALALLQIKGALNHGLGAMESAEGDPESGVNPPEALAQAGKVVGHLHVLYD